MRSAQRDRFENCFEDSWVEMREAFLWPKRKHTGSCALKIENDEIGWVGRATCSNARLGSTDVTGAQVVKMKINIDFLHSARHSRS